MPFRDTDNWLFQFVVVTVSSVPAAQPEILKVISNLADCSVFTLVDLVNSGVLHITCLKSAGQVVSSETTSLCRTVRPDLYREPPFIACWMCVWPAVPFCMFLAFVSQNRSHYYFAVWIWKNREFALCKIFDVTSWWRKSLLPIWASNLYVLYSPNGITLSYINREKESANLT